MISLPLYLEYFFFYEHDLRFTISFLVYYRARPQSPGPKFLSNADTSSTVNFVISQITNKDIPLCVQALAQVGGNVLNNIHSCLVIVIRTGEWAGIRTGEWAGIRKGEWAGIRTGV